VHPAVQRVLAMQRTLGNQGVVQLLRRGGLSPIGLPVVQRCGAERHAGCACAAGEQQTAIARVDAGDGATSATEKAGPAASGGLAVAGGESGACGPGTSNPFCLPIPGPNEPCKPFDTLDQGLAVWASLSDQVPIVAATATGCGEVRPVWDTYFAASSDPFAFSSSSSCVVQGAKTDPEGSDTAKRAAAGLTQDVIDNLPVLLRDVTPNPFPLGGPVAEIRLPLAEAIGPRGQIDLRPNIVYNNPFNAAANIAGGVGKNGQGSDIFGDDDRLMSGTVIIQVLSIDPSGALVGQVRWLPHVHVKDTVDFCPGNLGASFQRQFTLPMSKLEAQHLTRDVPITIDYDLAVENQSFSVMPLIGPLPPKPGPKPTPTPTPSSFPRSGPAKTTGSLLRIRKGPGLRFTALGLLGARGTPIEVSTQVRGDRVDGNDVWNKIDRGFVSDRFVAFDADTKP